MRTLLVGCDARTALSIHLALQLRWPEVAVVQEATRRQGLQALQTLAPSLVFVMTGPTPSDLDDLEFLQAARTLSPAALFALSSQPSDTEMTAALAAGADAYLSLPVNGPELLVKTIAVLRRAPELNQKR
jgi:DNA-binding response OmpR family regulator